MKLKIRVSKEIEIDESKLQEYAEECRARFSIEADAPVNMIDLLYQAQLDGDITLPEEFELEDYDEDLSPAEIADLVNSD